MHYFFILYDAIPDLIGQFGNIYVRKIELFPAIRIILASDFSIEFLSNADHILCDGTWKIIETDFQAFTVMIIQDGIFFPAVIYFTSTKDIEIYSKI